MDQIRNELNSYGMKDEWFEDFAISTLDELIKIISEHKELNKGKRKIIAKLMDYWRLAEYWIEKGDHDKALNIVQEGLEKGEGRKNELYYYLQEHYQKQGDYKKIIQ